MIMHLNPNKVFSSESLNTLRFAQKVNNTNIGTAQKVNLSSFQATQGHDLRRRLINIFRSSNKRAGGAFQLPFHYTFHLYYIDTYQINHLGVVHSATFFGKKPFGNFIFRKMFIWQHFIPKLLKSNELFGNKPNQQNLHSDTLHSEKLTFGKI